MASSIFSVKKKNTKQVQVVRTLRDTVQIGEQSFLKSDLNPSLVRFAEFWDLMETVKRHGYLRAAMSVVGKSAVGAWWSLRKHPEYKGKSPERHRKVLFEFYMFTNRRWDNIKDFQSFAYKLMIGVMYLRYFGQTAFQIIRDERGNPIGLDHLPGLVIPNVDGVGNFKSPAFVQYPTKDPSVSFSFEDPRDIVYITNPDWEGSPLGGTDIEALTDFTLPRH